jgi:hypothetical protein
MDTRIAENAGNIKDEERGGQAIQGHKKSGKESSRCAGESGRHLLPQAEGTGYREGSTWFYMEWKSQDILKTTERGQKKTKITTRRYSELQKHGHLFTA